MQKNLDRILTYLDDLFPQAHCELNYETPYQLLVAVILSAQCTDKRVNQVTEQLFKIAPTPQKMLNLGEEKLKECIKSCGFYNNKAKSILKATEELIEKYNCEVPNDITKLTKLAGVGRKTANVVVGEIYNTPAIAVDTHVLRVSKRLNLTRQNSTPEKCENDLKKIIKNDRQVKFHHQMIWFGRYHCKALKPNCENCALKDICNLQKNKIKSKNKSVKINKK